MSFTLLDAHRAIEPILGPPLNRAGVEELIACFEGLNEGGRVLLFTALALAADHQTSLLAEPRGGVSERPRVQQPHDDLIRRWFKAGRCAGAALNRGEQEVGGAA